MTRDEFITAYKIPSAVERTTTGFKIDGFERVALPCACGEDICNGWAMVSSEMIDDHMLFFAPPGSEDG